MDLLPDIHGTARTNRIADDLTKRGYVKQVKPSAGGVPRHGKLVEITQEGRGAIAAVDGDLAEVKQRLAQEAEERRAEESRRHLRLQQQSVNDLGVMNQRGADPDSQTHRLAEEQIRLQREANDVMWRIADALPPKQIVINLPEGSPTRLQRLRRTFTLLNTIICHPVISGLVTAAILSICALAWITFSGKLQTAAPPALPAPAQPKTD